MNGRIQLKINFEKKLIMLENKQKSILITGGSSGLGLALVKRLSKANYNVFFTYCRHTSGEIRNIMKENNIEYYNVIPFKVDNSNTKEIDNLFSFFQDNNIKLDYLINNSGIVSDGSIEELEVDEWYKVLDINLKGTVTITKKFLSTCQITSKEEKKIINIASYIGQVGAANQSNYSVSKAGIIAFTKSIAREIADKNISINSVCPGYVKTGLNEFSDKKEMRARNTSIMNIEANEKTFVEFVLFFLSSRVNGVTGQIFNLDSRII